MLFTQLFRSLELNDKQVLTHKGSISHTQMEQHVDTIYEKFESKRKLTDTQSADAQDLEELKQLEDKIKKLK